MNTSEVIVAVVPALLIVGAILAPILRRRDRSDDSHNDGEPASDRLALSESSGRKTQAELNERWVDIENLNMQPRSGGEGDRYFADWATLQARFAEPPTQATAESSALLDEAM